MQERTRSVDPLSLYLNDMRKYAYLEPEEEQELSRRWRDTEDAQALDRLVGSHLRLVVAVAKNFRRYGLPLSDLVAEGNLGLMRAARKFDPDKGYRFSTYAHWWIRAAIQEYILHNWSLVKIGKTTAQRSLFFSLRHLKARLHELESGDLPPDAVATIAAELKVRESEVVEMNRRLSADRSLNTPLGEEGDAEWQHLLADDRSNQEARLAEAEERQRRQTLIKLGLETLNDRDRQILVARHLLDEPVTADELGRRFNLTRQRIGQIEAAALQTLRKAVIADRIARAPGSAPRARNRGKLPAASARAPTPSRGRRTQRA